MLVRVADERLGLGRKCGVCRVREIGSKDSGIRDEGKTGLHAIMFLIRQAYCSHEVQDSMLITYRTSSRATAGTAASLLVETLFRTDSDFAMRKKLAT